ncbi:GNAT family N-acetyltransferase [Vreelandella venusta]|uniref:GNAT family N-acetyltransferase n=1 Tax=Vreelandella venusta TaxID=44935 RepID=A0AAQ0CIM3_9GAMM|nr:GNAT family N-acetyltransferase [Halomonas venusta]MBR9925195.1 GNAT family N-acetyltransferase [Gammaproteobacteria bacterium]AZM95222.1 GNAT family N-acetyltransferase [Halomonas venusta]MDW0360697.1 GNAT family N-acetyltransferase [Halomonas venusta]MDX1354169.1 GNAT family N-acetyltransferase [Halomonas venusta]MDX1714593.1 GNAT family N-acetyltransferase [Halomonas venusta]
MSTATIINGDWSTLKDIASEIRRVVFIEEQCVPHEEEWDGRDEECSHFIAYLEDQPVGTARLLPDGHIGRVAVLDSARGAGIGYQLMETAIQAAREAGHAHVALSAQLHALAFYQRLGFVAHGDTFMDAGIPHREMLLTL